MAFQTLELRKTHVSPFCQGPHNLLKDLNSSASGKHADALKGQRNQALEKTIDYSLSNQHAASGKAVCLLEASQLPDQHADVGRSTAKNEERMRASRNIRELSRIWRRV